MKLHDKTHVSDLCVFGCRYQSEVQRLRKVFRSAVAGDVARLREAVGEYKENTSRLECQKQLLLKQVQALLQHVIVIQALRDCLAPNGACLIPSWITALQIFQSEPVFFAW